MRSVATLVAVTMAVASLSGNECITVGGQGPAEPKPEVFVSTAAVQVFDQLRRPLYGVTVSLSADDQNIPARQTDARGFVAFPKVLPGNYRLDVHFTGFASLQKEIRVSAADKRSANLLAVMLLVSGECTESRLCPVSVVRPLDIAPLCVISPNPH
jgi:hypothetical protein